jgi:hypothetical protein
MSKIIPWKNFAVLSSNNISMHIIIQQKDRSAESTRVYKYERTNKRNLNCRLYVTIWYELYK